MTVAIVGILIFQTYWISNTYDVATRAFKQEVNVVLESVLSEEITNKTLNQIFGVHSMGIDSLHIEWNYQEYIKQEQLIAEPDDFMEVFSSVFISLVRSEPDLNEIYDNYSKELIARHIDIPFELAFVNNNRIIETIGDNSHDFSKSQAIQKLPGRLDSGDVIMAFFPKINSYLLKRMWLTILGSFLLVSLIAGSFILMFQTILKQKKVSEVKNDFINNMTHEFKTPIATVSAAMEALVSFDGLDDKDRSLRYIDISRKEMDRLSRLVEKVLSLSVFEEKKISLIKDTFDICKLLHETSQQYILKGGGRVHINCESAGSAYIHADKLHFHNVLNNLLDNAVKYSNEEVILDTLCERQGDYIVIQVKDNGVGISKEHQKHIFEKFFRVPTGDLHGVKGFGLGLNYVKHIVEMHGGTIGVTSQLGLGSEFTIAIPDIYE
ncbi:MAG: HAMP domain-containing histidine kinase [Bacteroidales bacterium]|nr:HAMP domain-containing histidine kinase [Bacteroidales bacterium]